ncbi:MAG: hypothetical protein VB092_02415 [Oscillospiraceae bacterium]|nr:hypothetical protein [Oscillospiraceae bacterium]
MRTRNMLSIPRFSGSQNRVLIQKTERRDRTLVLCCALFVIGVAAGALTAGFAKNTLLLEYIGYLVKTSVYGSADGTFFVTFLSSFAGAGGLIGLYYIFSLSAFGVPLLFALLLSCGAGVGLTCGCVYTAFGLKGALVNLLILPSDLLLAFAFILIGAAGLRCAAEVYGILLKNQSFNFIQASQLLSGKAIRSILLAAAAALLRAVCFCFFGGHIS